MTKLNLNRKSRRGHPKLDDDDRRQECVSVRLNKPELAILEAKRGNLMKGEFLRMAALDQLPKVVPELNKDAWIELSRAASNLNQVAHKLNLDEYVDADEIRRVFAEFRQKIIGIDTAMDDSFA
jgi:hypothetical protein